MNFLSVDTVSAQLHCRMDYFISWRHANSTHLPYSSFASNFEFLVSLFTSYDPKSHKISELYCFQILPSIKVNGGMAPCFSPPGFSAPEKYIMFQLKNHRGVMFDCIQDWYKVWRRTGLRFQKLTWGIWQIFTRAL